MAKGNTAATKRDVAGASDAEISESENMESVADEPLLHEFNRNPKDPKEEKDDQSRPKNKRQDDDDPKRPKIAKRKKSPLYDNPRSTSRDD